MWLHISKNTYENHMVPSDGVKTKLRSKNDHIINDGKEIMLTPRIFMFKNAI